MLGEGIALGRDFLPGDDQPGKNQVVLLSNRLWRNGYGADPGIIGRDIRMDGRPYTVIGVLPPGPSDRLPADLWMPLTFAPEEVNHTSRTLMIHGRLKPGVSIEQAQHEMTSIAAELARRVPTSNKGWSASVEPLQNNFLSADRRTTLWLLLAAVGFVVAIACVNVANLLLARGTVREREMAIRAAMGASRGHTIRQVLTESLVVAAAGGTLGVLSGAWLLEGLLAMIPRGMLPAESDPRLSVPVLLFALLTMTLCGLLFGSAPAWQASRVDLNEALKHGGRTSAGSGSRRLRQGLVVAELALAVISLAGAGLAIHSFWNRTQVDLGVRTEHTLTFSLHEVNIDDPRPRSPLVFRPVRTNQQGRATFDRLAPGRYRLWTTAVDRCANVVLTVSRAVAVSGSGTVETPLVVGGRATFHITSPLGPAMGVLISASPNVPPPPSSFAYRATSFGCRGATDADGRVTLKNFPPGPSHVDVHLGNSTYVRQIEVPSDGREVAVAIPEGLLSVHVVNALKNQPVAGATITWTGSGARVEATATASGDALLEGVGIAGGTLAASAQGYQPAEEQLTEPPGLPHTIALRPLPPAANLRPRVITTSGEPLRNAVVELISANPADVPRVSVTDAKGVATFSDVPSGSLQLIASADGFVTSTMRIEKDRASEVVFTLARGYRVIASVELPATAGPQLVRVVNDGNASIDSFLDSESDRRFEPPRRLSLGPFAPGTYVIELRGAGGLRTERIRIFDRDVYATLR
jgi:hypothetical protein